MTKTPAKTPDLPRTAMKTGEIYNRLTVLKKESGGKHPKWLFECTCGNLKIIDGYAVSNGHIKSCGCLKIKHGLYRHPIYYTWIRMRARCLNEKNKDYPSWGGRGITICKEWDEFDVFLKDMGDKPSSKHSLGRIDNEKGYSKENCRWETWIQQENNKRNNNFLEFQGRKLTLPQWARELGIRSDTLGWRIKNGWSVYKTLTVKP